MNVERATAILRSPILIDARKTRKSELAQASLRLLESHAIDVTVRVRQRVEQGMTGISGLLRSMS